LLLLSNAINGNHVSAQRISAVPVDVEVPMAPTPVRADGKIHLVYELHLTNLRARNLELTRLEVLKDEVNALPLASYKDAELVSRLARPGAPSDLPDKRIIGGGMRAVVFLQITFNTNAEVPVALRHRLFFKSDDPKGEERSVDTARVVVQRKPMLVVGPPVRGEGWLASNGMSNTSSHRRTLLVVNGKARIAQRFATDWTRIGADGLAFRGDPSKNANWSAYGTEVLAVANATVADVDDGIPENDPTADNKAVPITLDNAAGNYVILDLGNGYFALYAHLQPGKIRVKIGDKVKRSQVLALLGNSGNSDAPHLHFHITDGNSPLGAEGVPYVIESFEMQGILPSKGLLIEGGWKPQPRVIIDKRRLEIPIENAVVRFP
ncbi:MAG TPA: M23 family metallopeptidase, partial [Pyrinomonadaceae bacterium]|nr:M23 family metallopeptidase [Pyrinomonadaceae bacterium]